MTKLPVITLNLIDRADEIASGADLEFKPSFEAKAELAERFGLQSIDNIDIKAKFTKIPYTTRYLLEGEMAYSLTYSCVVSLKSIPVSGVFPLQLVCVTDAADFELPDLAEKDVEFIEGDQIDVCEIFIQSFSLCLDPFPKHDSLQNTQQVHSVGDSSPFSKLGVLKSKE